MSSNYELDREMDRAIAADAEPEREHRQFWYVRHTGTVQELTGYSCAPKHSDWWWWPKAGVSVQYGRHIFESEICARRVARSQCEEEAERIKAQIEQHQKRISELEAQGGT